jgi:hypothetical protein
MIWVFGNQLTFRNCCSRSDKNYKRAAVYCTCIMSNTLRVTPEQVVIGRKGRMFSPDFLFRLNAQEPCKLSQAK